MSAGLTEALPEAEVEAVLAHEVTHLMDGDSRAMGAALRPVLAADAAVAELTGSPAALAAALERLTEARRRPKADLREWERSVAVMDILPPEEPDVSTGPFRTHPPTAERVEHLSSLTEPVEVSR